MAADRGSSFFKSHGFSNDAVQAPVTILRELIENSIKYGKLTTAADEIAVRLQIDKDMYTIEVLRPVDKTCDDRLKERMDYAVKSLLATQLPNGYLGTYSEKDQFGEGDGEGWDGPVWDVWTHKYNLIGLLSYYQVTGDKKALEAAQRAADLM